MQSTQEELLLHNLVFSQKSFTEQELYQALAQKFKTKTFKGGLGDPFVKNQGGLFSDAFVVANGRVKIKNFSSLSKLAHDFISGRELSVNHYKSALCFALIVAGERLPKTDDCSITQYYIAEALGELQKLLTSKHLDALTKKHPELKNMILLQGVSKQVPLIRSLSVVDLTDHESDIPQDSAHATEVVATRSGDRVVNKKGIHIKIVYFEHFISEYARFVLGLTQPRATVKYTPLGCETISPVEMCSYEVPYVKLTEDPKPYIDEVRQSARIFVFTVFVKDGDLHGGNTGSRIIKHKPSVKIRIDFDQAAITETLKEHGFDPRLKQFRINDKPVLIEGLAFLDGLEISHLDLESLPLLYFQTLTDLSQVPRETLKNLFIPYNWVTYPNPELKAAEEAGWNWKKFEEMRDDPVFILEKCQTILLLLLSPDQLVRKMAVECIKSPDYIQGIQFISHQQKNLIEEAKKMKQFRAFLESGEGSAYVNRAIMPYLDEYFKDNPHYLSKPSYDLDYYKNKIKEDFAALLKEFDIQPKPENRYSFSATARKPSDTRVPQLDVVDDSTALLGEKEKSECCKCTVL